MSGEFIITAEVETEEKGEENMVSRAYFIIDADKDLGHEEFIDAISGLEKEIDVDFVDPVVGEHDVVVMVETGGSIEELAEKIELLPWVSGLKILKTLSAAERQRISREELVNLIMGGE